MTYDAVFDDIAQARLQPTLVQLSENLYGAVFSLMKLIPARHILRTALERGELDHNTTIVETTSGTFGLALAMEAALLHCRLVLVSDPVIGAPLRRRLEDLGAGINIVSEPSPTGGFQQSRLDRLAQLRRELGRTFCPEQYSNPANPASYMPIATSMADRIGDLSAVVGPVGSGGSMCGSVRALRAQGRDVAAIGVDTHHSTLFGQEDGPRQLRGLGNSLLPPNLDHTIFDQVHWTTPAVAYEATRRAHREHALYQGPTSGAALATATWWAARHPGQNCLVFLPDEGYRYDATVYNDDWLRQQSYLSQPPETSPIEVRCPRDAPDGLWSWMAWDRRSIEDVCGCRDATHAGIVQ